MSALQIKITLSDIPDAQAAAQPPPALIAAKQVSAGVSHIVHYLIDKGTLDWHTSRVMNDLLLLVVRPGITRRVLKTTDLNEEDKDTEGQYSDQDLKQYKDKDVEQPNNGSCT